MRRFTFAVVAAVLLPALAAGSCGGSTAQHADQAEPDVSYPEILTGPTGPDDPHNRQAQAPVPRGTSVQNIEFADASTGYALFAGCGSPAGCNPGLVVTLDGGYSWLARKLPVTNPTAVEMHVGRGNVLMIRAAPDGWFVSRDSGRTFQQRPLDPPPVEMSLTGPKYSVGCLDGGDSCQPKQLIQVADDGMRSILPAHPTGGQFTSLVGQDDGRLWLSVQHSDAQAQPPVNTVTIWTSTDHGKSWSSTGSVNLGHPDLQPRLAVMPDGSDVWLAGDRYAAERLPDGSWAEATTMHEVVSVRDAEVLPGRTLLVVSDQGLWQVDLQQRQHVDDRLKYTFNIRRLDATTLQSIPGQQVGETWLCAVQNKGCDWFRIAVTAP